MGILVKQMQPSSFCVVDCNRTPLEARARPLPLTVRSGMDVGNGWVVCWMS